MQGMTTLRLSASEQVYRDAITRGALTGPCPLCEKEAIQTFMHWRLVQNDFPYDRIAHKHDMLIPKRCVTEADLSPEERAELFELKRGAVNDMYDYLIEALHKKKSIPHHFHIHCITPKE